MTPTKASVLPSATQLAYPKAGLLPWPTPLERQPRLSAHLGIDLWVKRDDLTGLAFGGNKVRKLDMYFGQALMRGADTVLITGAVQSNYTRVVAACAARFGMECHLQLEERVAGKGPTYYRNGNVLVSKLMGATIHSYPVGNDEAGADARLYELADELRAKGRKPYVIPLGANNPPVGALGYVECAGELVEQKKNVQVIVLPSGSGQTHSGLLFGLRRLGWKGRVVGSCVRRSASEQRVRIAAHCARLSTLLNEPNAVDDADIEVADAMLGDDYGAIGEPVAEAMRLAAQKDGLVLDPIYTGRAMATLVKAVAEKGIAPGSTACLLHTGGLPALFAYEAEIADYFAPK